MARIMNYYIIMHGVHIWYVVCLWCVFDNELFILPICPWSQGQRCLKFVMWLVSRIPLTFLIDGVHIWHTAYLWCVDDNEGFGV